LQRAIRAGVVFANGEIFYADEAGAGELRLCFASQPPDKIEEGIKRLTASFRIEDGHHAPHEESLMPVV